MSAPDEPDVDWSITTFEGARREQMRRWAELPLIEILAALEEMETLAGLTGAGALEYLTVGDRTRHPSET